MKSKVQMKCNAICTVLMLKSDSPKGFEMELKSTGRFSVAKIRKLMKQLGKVKLTLEWDEP